MKSFARGVLLAGAVATSLIVPIAAPAYAQTTARNYSIPAQDLGDALRQFGAQSGRDIVFDPALTAGKKSKPVAGAIDADRALQIMLEGSGLSYTTTSTGFAVRSAVGNVAADANSASSQGEGTAGRDEIVVVGTNIRGKAPAGSPLSTYTREDIDRTGAVTVEQFLQRLPENTASTRSDLGVAPGSGSSAENGTFGSAADLHGLGPGATLTLVNGHRLAPGGNDGQFADISAIPLAIIENVQVLSDGASAIYGSDAVAGVVNFNLRDNYSGAETTVGGSTMTRSGGGGQVQISQLVGTNWTGGHFLGAYEYYAQNPLETRDRDFVPSGFDSLGQLLPRQRRHNGFVAAAQRFGDVKVSIDGLYSSRRFAGDFGSLLTGVPSVLTGRNEQYVGNLAFNVPLFSDWSFDIVGTHAASNSHSSQLLFGSFLQERRARARLSEADAKLTGSVLELPGGDVRLAMGGGLRRETFGELALTAGGIGKRTVSSAFAELYLPIIGLGNRSRLLERLALSLAGRYDHYSDFGSAFSPKGGVSWAVREGLSFRGSYGRSFKAPALSQLSNATQVLFTFPLLDPASPTGISPTLLRFGTGNPDLKAERSRAWTVGADIERQGISGFSGSISYFSIRYQGRIAGPNVPGGFTNLFNFTDQFAPYIELAPDLAEVEAAFEAPNFVGDFAGGGPSAIVAIFNSVPANAARDISRGLDFRLSHLWDTGTARWTAFVSGTAYLKANRKATPATPELPLAGVLSSPSKLRLIGGIQFGSRHFGSGISLNYVKSYRNPNFSPPTRIDHWLTFDFNASYTTPDGAPLALRGLTISANVQNLFDEDPPRVTYPLEFGTVSGYDPINANPYGRIVSARLLKRW
jgi:outer membrane receptor protein involved in Fe transport